LGYGVATEPELGVMLANLGNFEWQRVPGSGDVENIWAYNDNGRPWSERNLADETFE
jgi:hypothetical protein